MTDDRYLWDRSGDVDDEIARLEKTLGTLKYKAPAEARVSPRANRTNRRKRNVAAFGGLALAAAIAIGIGLLRPPADVGPSFALTRVAGAPRVGASPIAATDRLPVGPWLETDGTSRAQITVAQIGDVDVLPGSRVRLVGTTSREHRLELARGKIHARVVAPPRLFVVDTPAATAFDLGCAYDLDVDDDGATILRVTSGQVSLEGHGRAAWVPEGAACETPRGDGPGTPYFLDAPEPLRAALRRLDRAPGDAAALRSVLDTARPRDALTLWHLASRVSEADGATIRAKLSDLAPIPDGVLPKDGGLEPSKSNKKEPITNW